MNINDANTPFFLIKENELQENINVFENALKKYWNNSYLAYSVKTNSLPWILNFMCERNIKAEVVSDEEYLLAKKCGYKDSDIVFNGPIKTVDLFKYSLENGAIVNIDSKREVECLKKNPELINKNVGIRINVDTSIFNTNDIGYEEDGFRFGFSDESGELEEVLKLFPRPLSVGIHLHCNSVTRSLDVYKKLSKYCSNLIKKYDWKPNFIDIGGGFFGGVKGKPNAMNYICEISEVFNEIIDLNKTKLIVEPGSAIIGSVVDLYSSVLDVKDTLHSRIVTTDASRIHIDPLWKKGTYMFDIISKNNLLNKEQVICGYTCMDHDRIMKINKEQELSIGDKIIYRRVGAYSMTFGGPFIRYFPDVYVQNKEHIKRVRTRMSVSDYFKMNGGQ